MENIEACSTTDNINDSIQIQSNIDTIIYPSHESIITASNPSIEHEQNVHSILPTNDNSQPIDDQEIISPSHIASDNQTSEITGNYSSILADIDKLHNNLFDNISKAKKAHTNLCDTINILKEAIDAKQKTKEILKKEITQLLATQDEPMAAGDITHELNISYKDVREKSCSHIRNYADSISATVAFDFNSCFSLVNNLGQEVNLLKTKLEYIRILKALDKDLQLYKDLTGRRKEAEGRFQSLANFFRLDT